MILFQYLQSICSYLLEERFQLETPIMCNPTNAACNVVVFSQVDRKIS